MIAALEALALGIAFGAIFGATSLPMPAPPTITGVVGILGVTLGFLALRHLRS